MSILLYFHLFLMIIVVAYILLGITFIKRFNTLILSKTVKTIFLLGYLALLGCVLYIILSFLFLGCNC
ncbi:hypothetical protein GGH11_07090 [Streptococcus sp. zg-70]|uniref:Uncharacterized protein n=1 Tax=Streptococcus zhangguiae TaxID=2664091 RepID=A0A6I4RAB1_9STRE|nr:hypothetical protein [Streptococcus sp. zg-70]